VPVHVVDHQSGDRLRVALKGLSPDPGLHVETLNKTRGKSHNAKVTTGGDGDGLRVRTVCARKRVGTKNFVLEVPCARRVVV